MNECDEEKTRTAQHENQKQKSQTENNTYSPDSPGSISMTDAVESFTFVI